MFMLKLLLLSAIATAACGCYIHNTDSGFCTRKYLPASSELADIESAKKRWTADLPFCGRFIASYYAPCVPSLPIDEWRSADINFPDGRLDSSSTGGLGADVDSIRNKDRWVEETVANSIEARIESERRQGSQNYHYFRNKDCQEAYARYACWLNFPRCDDKNESLPMCQSVCENLFRVCGFAPDIWRCEEDVIDGNGESPRGFFPGQPFVKNTFMPKTNEPMPICTPSIKGTASSRYGISWVGIMLVSRLLLQHLCGN